MAQNANTLHFDKRAVVADGNLGVGTGTFGEDAFGNDVDKSIVVATGVVAPATSPADSFQLYSADQAAGNAAPHFRTENGKIVKLYQQVLAAGLEEAYEAGELDIEAEVIAALNATNAKLNDLIEAIHNTGLLASS